MVTRVVNPLRAGSRILLKIKLEKLDHKLDRIYLRQLILLLSSVYSLCA